MASAPSVSMYKLLTASACGTTGLAAEARTVARHDGTAQMAAWSIA